MKPLHKAHACMFFGTGMFAGGVVALIHDAALWITIPLLASGVAIQIAGLWIHWRIRRAAVEK